MGQVGGVGGKMKITDSDREHNFDDDKVKEAEKLANGHVYCSEPNCGRYWCTRDKKVY